MIGMLLLSLLPGCEPKLLDTWVGGGDSTSPWTLDTYSGDAEDTGSRPGETADDSASPVDTSSGDDTADTAAEEPSYTWLDCDEVTDSYAAPDRTACVGGVAAWLSSDGSTYSTIADAVASAPEGDTLTVCPGTWPTSVELSISLTLRGYGVDETVLTGEGSRRILLLHNGTLRVEGMALREGWDDYKGGAMLAEFGDVSFSYVLFEDNVSQSEGGALNAYDASVAVSSSCFRGNSARVEGGALALERLSDLAIMDSVFTQNTSDDEGGAITASLAEAISVQDSVFTENEAGYEGGALSLSSDYSDTEVPTAILSGCTFLSNTSGHNGGAVSFTVADDPGYDLSISGSWFEQNVADYSGGAIALSTLESDNLSLTLSASTLVDNEADFKGGAIDSSGWGAHELYLDETWIESNASQSAGAISATSWDVTTIEIQGGGVIGNSGEGGVGGIELDDDARLEVVGADFGVDERDNNPTDVNWYGTYGASATFTCESLVCS